MEVAPLTLAHTHARNAVLETRKSNPVAASEEHDLAAGEFATVAQTSSDREALRTLQLLEHHHKKLAQILRFQHEHPPAATGPTVPSSSATATSSSPATAAIGVATQVLAAELGVAKALSDAQQQPPKLSGNPRLPSRESSSIASNLASARGIPAQPRRASPVSPTLSSQQAGAKMTEGLGRIRTSESRLRGAQSQGSRDRANRAAAPKQPWSPPGASPTDITSQQIVPPDAQSALRTQRHPVAADDSFQRFYSTFEGLISRLSAPLAFAGLPLGSDGTSQANPATSRKSPAEPKIDRQPAVPDRSSHSVEPDVSKIFSRAALRAIRDSTGGAGGVAGAMGGAAESFYVVPTTGGTVSYAGILTRAEKEARRNSLEEADEDFVDARETPSSPEMLQSFSGSKGKTSRITANKNDKPQQQSTKTMEELQMENQALRHLSDTLSKRLHMWEVNAQSSSMALQQSLKAMHNQNLPFPEPVPHQSSSTAPYAIPSPPITSVSPATPQSIEQEQRIKDLEEIIRRSEKELEQVGRENEKLRNVLVRYRERWEKLKEGAKTRRESSVRNNASQNSKQTDNSSVQGGEPGSEAARASGNGDTEQESTSNDPDGKTDGSDS